MHRSNSSFDHLVGALLEIRRHVGFSRARSLFRPPGPVSYLEFEARRGPNGVCVATETLRTSAFNRMRAFNSRFAGLFPFRISVFKPFAFLAAQPYNILLYRNLLRSRDCPLRQSLATRANH